MADDAPSEVTTVLEEIRAGNPDALNKLARLVYDELRRIAAGLMRQERTDHTLQPTALVNEAMLRLLSREGLEAVQNRKYFFGAAARAMRQVLVDHARSRAADKRGGGRALDTLDEVLAVFERQNLDLLALNEALDELARLSARQSQVVTLRFFGGLTVPEVAEQLDVSVATVESDFRLARAFLRSRLTADG
jgi:RNA polymerase sigma factor (TIGR02999 family)